MNDIPKASERTTQDLVLQEIWQIKDALSESYGHDVHRLFAEARKHEKQSGHAVVNLQSEDFSSKRDH